MDIDTFSQILIKSFEASAQKVASIGADRHSHASVSTDLSEKSLYFLSVECLYSRNPEPTLSAL